ncbi:MAG: uracil-DNA glycosylase [Chloroflexota bacterium]|nr:uracil-DNA glycosylase [Chloroflexota bacterium]
MQCPDAGPPVFAEGNPAATLAIVGEAPSERDESTGRPFTGPTGLFLDSLLREVGLRREELWITNVVKCRPTKLEGQLVRNRTPTQAEIRSWADELRQELEAVSPKVVLCFGATAASAIIKRGFKLSQERGQWFPGPAGSRAIATFNPAYVLRLEGEAREVVHLTVLHDMRQAAEAARDG